MLRKSFTGKPLRVQKTLRIFISLIIQLCVINQTINVTDYYQFI